MSSKRELVENKEVVQGVLIVDNFNDNFAPLTDEKPFVSSSSNFIFITSKYNYFL